MVSKIAAANLQLLQVANGLHFSPRAQRVRPNLEQVGFGKTRETNQPHSSASPARQLEPSANPREGIPLDNTAGVAIVNSVPQSRQLCLVLLFLAFQRSKRRPHDFARALIPAAFDLRRNEAVQLIGQVRSAQTSFASPSERHAERYTRHEVTTARAVRPSGRTTSSTRP